MVAYIRKVLSQWMVLVTGGAIAVFFLFLQAIGVPVPRWVWWAALLVAVVLAQFFVYREAVAERETALEKAVTLQAEIKHLTNTAARKREIREGLAALIAKGDDAWRQVSQAYQVWEVWYVSPLVRIMGELDKPEDDPKPEIPDWTKDVLNWRDKVESYLIESPELGQSYLDLFRAQDPATSPERGVAPLSKENRMKSDMAFIRLRQQRLREFMGDFK